MGAYHCNKVADALQDTKLVYVFDKDASSWKFKYKDASLNLRTLPGCCGVLHLYNISGSPKTSFKLLKLSLAAAKRANFGMVTLSLLTKSPLRKLITGPEWTTTPFTNPRTRNEVELLAYKIPVKLKTKPVANIHEDR